MREAFIVAILVSISANVQGMRSRDLRRYSLPTPERSPMYNVCKSQVFRDIRPKLMPSTPPQQEASPPRSNKLSKNTVSTDFQNSEKLIQTYIKANQKLLHVIFNLRRIVHKKDEKWIDKNQNLLKDISSFVETLNTLNNSGSDDPQHVVVPLKGEEELPFYAAENRRLWKRVGGLVKQLQSIKQTNTKVEPSCSNSQEMATSTPKESKSEEIFAEFISWEPNAENS